MAASLPSASPEQRAAAAAAAHEPGVDLHHPLPDLQSLQGAYVGNISRLEEHAERMSEAGSDLNEEIRRLHSELKLVDSRRSSLRSLSIHDDTTTNSNSNSNSNNYHHANSLARVHTGRSRNLSTSSYAHSVVYSPGGYVTSPVGSFSQQRHRSGSKASRLGQVVHSDHDHDHELPTTAAAAAMPASPTSPASPSSIMATPIEHRPPPLGQRHVSSFTRKYEEIANEIRDEIRHSVPLDRDDDRHVPRDDTHAPYDDGQAPYTHYEMPDRPPTAASTDTTHQARTLWHDFDGTHAPDTVPEEPEPEPGLDPSSPTHSRSS
ncbi:hypothetical protein N0V95_010005, partial [Ascochyta clinopodiicola]